MVDIYKILRSAVEEGASDVLIIPNEPPTVRIGGKLRSYQKEYTLDAAQSQEVIYSLLDRAQIRHFEKDLELDGSLVLPDVARFRVNVFRQENGIAAVLRIINDKIPGPSEIGLTQTVVRLTAAPRGLILVTGPTGSGKSTTLASLIEHINLNYSKNIITIEDPIEYTYKNKKSLINQREVGRHTLSFQAALRAALRQNPDIILVGEMRDRETMSLALTAAETGHLCFSTLHTKDAPSTVERIVDEFPSDQQTKVQAQLASLLTAVISQVMLPKKSGAGVVCAREIMVASSAVGALIREGKMHQLPGAIESGAKSGMISMDQHLALLIRQGQIRPEDAIAKAREPESLKGLVAMAAQSAGPAPGAPSAVPPAAGQPLKKP